VIKVIKMSFNLKFFTASSFGNENKPNLFSQQRGQHLDNMISIQMSYNKMSCPRRTGWHYAYVVSCDLNEKRFELQTTPNRDILN